VATPPSPATTAARLAPVLPQTLFGLLRPFGTDQARDLAQGSGDDLLESRVGQVIGSAGEFPWRPGLTSRLDRARNIANGPALSEFCRVWVSQALATFVPEVVVQSATATRDVSGRTLNLTVTCSRVSDLSTTPPKTFTASAALPF
jgi:hypothetical protein